MKPPAPARVRADSRAQRDTPVTQCPQQPLLPGPMGGMALGSGKEEYEGGGLGSEKGGMVLGPLSLGEEKLGPEFLSMWEFRPLYLREKGLMWNPRSGCGRLGSRLLGLKQKAEVRVGLLEGGMLKVYIPGSRREGLGMWTRRFREGMLMLRFLYLRQAWV